MGARSTSDDGRLELAPEQVAELLAHDAIAVIDVREPYERAAGHIDPSRHIPLERLPREAASVPRDRPVVFACRLGARSGLAARAFRDAGWEAWNLRGGLIAWSARGLPLAPEGGVVADH